MDSDGSLSPSQAALQMAEFTLPPSSVEAGSAKASKIGEDILYPLENCIKNMSPKMGPFQKEISSSNHWCLGGMLVFGE